MSFSRMIRGMAVAVVAMTAFALTTESANAQYYGHHGHRVQRGPSCYGGGFSHYSYRPGLSISLGTGYGSGIGFGYSNRMLYSRPVYHNTTHYDYHPGGYIRHRNHLHYVPGHYDLHRTGHWHR